MVRLVLSIAGVAAAGAWCIASMPDPRLDAIKGYRSWKQATNGPQDMTPSLALSCIGPRKQDQPPNPHTRKVFLVYVNFRGASAMASKNRADFPDGTVIVKEKYDRGALKHPGSEDWSPVDMSKLKGRKPELLTVMRKKGGQWEYYAVDAGGKLMSGDTAYCAACHETAKGNDFVFRPYVSGPVTVRLKSKG